MLTRRRPASAILTALLLSPLVLALVATPASATNHASILAIDLGTPEGPAALQAIGYAPCTTGAGCYELVSPATFSVDPNLFVGHDVLFVGWTENAANTAIAALNARASDIEQFVLAGGAIVALSEYALGQFQWVPQGNQLTLFQEHLNDIVVTQASHPIMAGLTDASLSGWGNSRHNYVTSYPAYLGVISTANNPMKAVNLAGHYGAGCVALIGQDPDWHIHYGGVAAASILLRNAIAWGLTCECEEAPCTPTATLSGTPHPRHSTFDPASPFDHVSLDRPRSVSLGLSWVPVVGGPVSADFTFDAETLSVVDELRDAFAPPRLPVDPAFDDRGELPRFYGATTVQLRPCDCEVKDVNLSYVVINDVPPTSDPIGPIATQTGPTTWTITAADYDEYRITFNIVLVCPDGTVENVTLTWDQVN